MRHVLTSVVLLVLMFPSLALGGEVTMDDLIFRSSDGLHYKKFTKGCQKSPSLARSRRSTLAGNKRLRHKKGPVTRVTGPSLE